MIDPHGRPTDITYSERLAVPGALKDRLWTGEGYSEQTIYAHTLAHQARDGPLIGKMMYWGITDPSSEAFGLLLWQHGEKVDCRRCHCEILRWHKRGIFCSQRCRTLWLLSHAQGVAVGLAVVGTVTTAAMARRL